MSQITKINGGNAKELGSLDSYKQQIVSNNNNAEFISYNVISKDTDISKYTNNMCMIYISGIEIEKEQIL